MEDLLKPDYGVLALTVCSFLLLVYLLKKFAWNRIIGALEAREQQIAQDKLQAFSASFRIISPAHKISLASLSIPPLDF